MKRLTVLVSLFSLFCVRAQNYNYYFGNLHSHTAYSDGNKDSTASGIKTPASSFAYAKLSADFDFLGISEHNHYSNSKNPGFRQPLYQMGLNEADNSNAEGNFLALYGMEYGVSSEYNGHVVIYGFSQLIGWEASVPGVTGNNYDIFNGKTDYDGLFRKVKNKAGAFAYLAHPSFSDFTTDGTFNTALTNAPYNAAYDSAIVGLPLRSGLANSADTNYSDYSSGNYFNYYKKLLYNGYHLGIGYDHDNHYTNFGRSNGGRLVILAPSLTRNNLYNAMTHYNFYGSDDPNAKVDFRLNGQIMGSIIKGNGHPVLQVNHLDPNGELADSIKIWKGWSNSGGLWANIIQTSLHSNSLMLTDSAITPLTEYYYFAELRQTDGQWIVTSPIWYTALSLTGVNENPVSTKFGYCYDPVSKNISVSTSQNHEFEVRILDLAGREIFRKSCTGNAQLLDVSDLPGGLYLVELKTGAHQEILKLVTE